MKKIVIIIFFGSILGCSAMPTKVLIRKNSQISEIINPEVERQSLKNIPEENLGNYQEIKGVVFAKTNFEGILKARFVKLIFENLANPELRFQLYIGDKSKSDFNLDSKFVEPGYFYIEFPAGKYKLASLSIPVGSTLATEDVNVVFSVVADRITYIGTLNVEGTKERLKLGGVPVIKPGFDYTLSISNDEEEAAKDFHLRYPTAVSEVDINLMTQGSL